MLESNVNDWCNSIKTFFKKSVGSNDDLRELLELATNSMYVVSRISLEDLQFCKANSLANTLQEMVLQEVLCSFTSLSCR